MNTKTTNAYTLAAELDDVFGNHVRQMLSETFGHSIECSVNVQFIERTRSIDMLMFFVVVKPLGTIDLDKMRKLIDALDQYCTNIDTPTTIGDRHFLLGDGDDSMAVQFYSGAFHIWLRGWKQNPMA